MVSLLISHKEMNSKEKETQNSYETICFFFYSPFLYFLASVEILAQLDRKYPSFLKIVSV